MKKLISVLLALLIFVGCSNGSNTAALEERYFDMLDLLNQTQTFQESPTYYDITVELIPVDEGYRYYVVIDNPKIAMYNVQIMAIVEGDDYSESLAANVGIFEEITYNMIPNQANVDKGYVRGLSISGVTDRSYCFVDILVRYEKGELNDVVREYYRYELSLESAEDQSDN